MPREWTNRLVDMAEYGEVSWEGIARECLQRMSEQDVKDMCIDMDWDGDMSECEP